MAFESPEKAALKATAKDIGALPTDTREVLLNSLVEFEAERPQPEDFADIYSAEMIEKDRQFITKREAQFNQTNTPEDWENSFFARIVEKVIQECGNGWVAADFSPASHFDDLHNGIDVVGETMLAGGEHGRFGVDVTVDRSKVGQKLKLIKSDLAIGKFRELKYFQSNLEAGLLLSDQRVPKVVVYVSKPTAIRLVQLYALAESKHQGQLPLNQRDLEMKTERQRLLNNLRSHFFGPKMRRQILGQLAAWQAELAEAVKRNIPDAGKKLAYLKNLEKALSELPIKEKSPQFGDERDDQSDQILLEILATV